MKGSKTVNNAILKKARELDLGIGFVPLCAPKRPLTVKCPMCGLVMDAVLCSAYEYEYFCPECGIRG